MKVSKLHLAVCALFFVGYHEELVQHYFLLKSNEKRRKRKSSNEARKHLQHKLTTKVVFAYWVTSDDGAEAIHLYKELCLRKLYSLFNRDRFH